MGSGTYYRACGRSYLWDNSFLNLLADLESRFVDERAEERDLLEENASTYSTLHYYLPLVSQLFATLTQASPVEAQPRILSNGCGVAADVDLFNEHGFDAYGIDCGERIWTWTRRRFWKRFLVPVVRLYFQLLSLEPLAWLRATSLNPWLIVLAQK